MQDEHRAVLGRGREQLAEPVELLLAESAVALAGHGGVEGGDAPAVHDRDAVDGRHGRGIASVVGAGSAGPVAEHEPEGGAHVVVAGREHERCAARRGPRHEALAQERVRLGGAVLRQVARADEEPHLGHAVGLDEDALEGGARVDDARVLAPVAEEGGVAEVDEAQGSGRQCVHAPTLRGRADPAEDGGRTSGDAAPRDRRPRIPRR